MIARGMGSRYDLRGTLARPANARQQNGGMFEHWKLEEEGRPRSRLVTYVAVALAVALLGFGAYRIVAYWNDVPAPPSDRAGLPADYTVLEHFETGDCFDDPEIVKETRAGTGADMDLLAGAVLIDCDQPHDAEVFAQVKVASSVDYPQWGRFEDTRPRCRAALAGYVADDDLIGGLDVWLIPPTPAGWERRSRQVACVAVSADAQPRSTSLASR
jgi:hypothetical protein